MNILFPEIKPYRRHQLRVSELHEIYVDEAGNPDGIPLLFVHGGPGAACDVTSRRFFDPSVYRIVTFDQRGCGRSTPHGELRDNDTQALISDMEKIREHLEVDRWVLFGGSWGSTLSLLYGQAHPERVKAFILRGIFLGRQEELDWLYKNGARKIFPDHWEEFEGHIPEAERGDLIKAYYDRLNGPDELARMSAAKCWAAWEGQCSRLRPSAETMAKMTKPHNALAISRIETHFFVNKCFIEDNQILKNMKLIADLPAVIVHGRYDMVCPLVNAAELHQHWPNAELQIIREAGHSASEPGNLDALIRACRDIVKSLDAVR